MRHREKNCAYCQKSTEICYRIQYDTTQQWQLVCPACQKQLKKDNPFYRYGGTWKAKKKK
ncbi:hypothetical protein [[Limnothrix rosea] IAM M-220]|uniref:hypothetical protein n=1 Tax=[Limnothrix rosea] IAM M-220 TaxID=454133 RepID=UPI0009624B55|nr:hypothetical protein [[Limnothrix rosea] IAM M-220]OKH14595.1 hypothetical protein NIES208_13930 [[Limnothrix rosea] IAM M-220]